MNVLLTGAAGRIGTMLRERLPDYGVALRLFDREPLAGGIVGDVADAAALDEAFTGELDAVVHLAGQPTEAPWTRVREDNIEGAYQLFEAARRHGVGRVVYASSNHAVGFTARGFEDLPADTQPRPDTLYGVSKVFGEALARYYVERYGLQVACLRIGTCSTTPPDYRSLATWLSPDDCARLVHAALIAPDLTYALVWGVSANTRRWWSLDAGRAIGYEPLDDADSYIGQLPAERDQPLDSDDLVGGGYTTYGFGIDQVLARDDA
ncbi:MAG TPA: NAD(P)-dependent oxidoreductase [Jatrophihabitantaceae bacterium]|nr:NAD(P)-dependent oxidoreductase [Jatrophihabitantaceae bacterium]